MEDRRDTIDCGRTAARYDEAVALRELFGGTHEDGCYGFLGGYFLEHGLVLCEGSL